MNNMSVFSVSKLKYLFSLVILLRLGSLCATLYAVGYSPLKFYEKNPVVSPVFNSIGTTAGTAVYAMVLLFAMFLLIESVGKTHTRWYPAIFMMYYAVLVVSTLDFTSDILLVGFTSLYTFFPYIATATVLVYFQGAGVFAGLQLLESRRLFDNRTSRQTIALLALIWPLYVYLMVIALFGKNIQARMTLEKLLG